jgi:hypothetical protein
MPSAAWFHEVITPLMSLPTIASSEEATMAARRDDICSACFWAPISRK